jgi:hypothetical protein
MTAHDTRSFHGAVGGNRHFIFDRTRKISLLRELRNQGLNESLNRALLRTALGPARRKTHRLDPVLDSNVVVGRCRTVQ